MNHEATVLIADDHAIFRHVLRDVIEQEPRFKVVGEASDGEKALEQLVCLKPQILILDIDMPHLDGLDTIRKIREQPFQVKVIILTMHEEEEIFNATMDWGAKAYVLKENAANDVVAALEKVDRGENFVSASMLEAGERHSDRVRELLLNKSRIESLTPAERRILKLIGEAFTGEEIAEQLKLSLKTVETCQSHICSKLKLPGAHSLLKFAFDNSGNIHNECSTLPM